jgi:predicted transposase YdaD
LNAERLLASDAPADQVLALLSDSGGTPAVLAEISERLSALPENERQDWFERLMALAGLRGVEDLVREEAIKMGISLDIRNNKFFREAYTVGLEDGKQEGLKQGETALLRRQLERRFGVLPDWASQRLESLSPAALEEAGLRLLDAATLEEVLGTQPN